LRVRANMLHVFVGQPIRPQSSCDIERSDSQTLLVESSCSFFQPCVPLTRSPRSSVCCRAAICARSDLQGLLQVPYRPHRKGISFCFPLPVSVQRAGQRRRVAAYAGLAGSTLHFPISCKSRQGLSPFWGVGRRIRSIELFSTAHRAVRSQ